MRSGTLRSWNEARRKGTIEPDDGGAKCNLVITAPMPEALAHLRPGMKLRFETPPNSLVVTRIAPVT